MERVSGIEPPSSAWKADIIATIRYPPAVSIFKLVGVRGLEPPASCSQSTRATNCATPRKLNFHKILNGATGRNWTTDTRIFSPLLYHWATVAWWAWENSNLRPLHYQCSALTNWATCPCLITKCNYNRKIIPRKTLFGNPIIKPRLKSEVLFYITTGKWVF